MNAAVSESEAKRAVNQIWNAAADHAFMPDFKAYDAQARAELYWNTIIGAVRRHYDYSRIEPVFRSFQEYEDGDIYESLLWIGLENAVYGREAALRPVLASLRLEYARRYLSVTSVSFDSPWYEKLIYTHYARITGADYALDRRSAALLDELEFSPELDTDALLLQTKELFAKWLQISTELRPKRRFFHLSVPLGKKGKERYRPFGAGFADHPRRMYGAREETEEDLLELRTTMSAGELRSFMEAKFGRSCYSPQDNAQLERELCTGNHEHAHLLITRGETAAGKIQNGFEALKKQQEAAQKEKNREYARAHQTQNATAIAALSAKIQNSMLQHLQSAPVRAPVGRLLGGRVWRALYLNEHRVFEQIEQDNMGDISVDILLDASTSQERRLENVSNQAYVIAESLSRCGIPCRVLSFCSMTGYTVLHIFRDYRERGGNERIFDFVANGCNRDGLAIRAACRLIRDNPCEHRLLIILSDVKPNDVLKLSWAGEAERVPYSALPGLTDTALEVRRARAEGISVVCVFTGDDEDVASVKYVYGRDFTRILSLSQMADSVGKLIQNQINMI